MIKNYGFGQSGNDLIDVIKDSTGGFTTLLDNLKAYLEYNIQLNLVCEKFLNKKNLLQIFNTVMPTTISTERLSLNVLTIQDHPFMRELINTQGWLTFIGDRNIHSDEDAIAYINKINSTPDFTYWMVRLKHADKPIGVISFLKRSYLQHFDIGFAFLPEYCGQGFAYEAAAEVLSILKQVPAYATILATTIPANVSSVKLLTRLGFSFEKEIEEGGNELHVYANAG